MTLASPTTLEQPATPPVACSDLLNADFPFRCVGGRKQHNYGIMEQSGFCVDCRRSYSEIVTLRQAEANRRRKLGLPGIGRNGSRSLKAYNIQGLYGEGI